MKEENIEDNLVFRINRRKTFALKLIQKNYFSKSVTLEQNTFIFYFICLLLVYYITKQTVYQNKFTRKSRFRFERSDDEDLGNPLSFPPPPPPPPPQSTTHIFFNQIKKILILLSGIFQLDYPSKNWTVPSALSDLNLSC